MKRLALTAAFALLAASAFAGAALADEPPAAAAAEVPPVVTLADLFADTAEPALASDPAAEAVDLAGDIIPPPTWCPYGAPTCKKHDDCDAYCGDPRFGWCFFDTHCCGCSG